MAEILNNTKLQQKLGLIFKIMILVYTIVSWNAITYGTFVVSIVMWPMLFVGMILLLWRTLQCKSFWGAKGVVLFLLFLGCFMFSAVMNYNYGFKDNIILFVFLCFYFLILYVYRNDWTSEDIKKEFFIVSHFFMIYMALMSLIAFILMFAGYADVIEQGAKNKIVIGFVWGRLWGIALEPNQAALMSVVVIFISLYYFGKCQQKWMKIVYCANGILQLFYVAFSDSRTAMVALGGAMGVFFFLTLKKKSYFQKNVSKKILLLLYTLAVMIVVTLLPKGITKAYNGINGLFQWREEKVERGYDLSEDYSNQRFDIWKSGLEIFAEKPVYGTSYYGIRPYAEENMPDTYIIDNDFAELRNLHNEVLNIFVSMGLLGGSVFIGLVSYLLFFIITRWKTLAPEDEKLCKMILASLLSMGVGAMLTSAGMFFYNAPIVPMFWIMLGYMMALMSNAEKEVKK